MNYLVVKKVESKNRTQMLVNVRSFFSLKDAGKYYRKTKDKKRNVPFIYPDQKVITELVLYRIGNLDLLEKNNREYWEKEVLERSEVMWNGKKSNEIQKQEN